MATRVLDGALGRPAPRLRSLVDQYRGYWQDGYDPGVHHGLPSRYLTLIVSIEEPVDIVGMPDEQQSPEAFDAFVAGLHASPALIRHEGRQRGVHVDVTPLGAQALLGLPASAIASTIVNLREALGAGATELVDRLGEARTWTDRFAAIDDVFSRAVVEVPEPAGEVAWAWQRILETGGTVEVRDLAAEIGWSRRHFGERFRSELGLAPKVASRVIRFERARELLARPDRPGLADVAATCGYFDQAHLTREWRDLAGCTPTTWLAEETVVQDLPSVQDADVIDVAR
jgi:AraC-like DNA-binding protein